MVKNLTIDCIVYGSRDERGNYDFVTSSIQVSTAMQRDVRQHCTFSFAAEGFSARAPVWCLFRSEDRTILAVTHFFPGRRNKYDYVSTCFVCSQDVLDAIAWNGAALFAVLKDQAATGRLSPLAQVAPIVIEAAALANATASFEARDRARIAELLQEHDVARLLLLMSRGPVALLVPPHANSSELFAGVMALLPPEDRANLTVANLWLNEAATVYRFCGLLPGNENRLLSVAPDLAVVGFAAPLAQLAFPPGSAGADETAATAAWVRNALASPVVPLLFGLSLLSDPRRAAYVQDAFGQLRAAAQSGSAERQLEVMRAGLHGAVSGSQLYELAAGDPRNTRHFAGAAKLLLLLNFHSRVSAALDGPAGQTLAISEQAAQPVLRHFASDHDLLDFETDARRLLARKSNTSEIAWRDFTVWTLLRVHLAEAGRLTDAITQPNTGRAEWIVALFKHAPLLHEAIYKRIDTLDGHRGRLIEQHRQVAGELLELHRSEGASRQGGERNILVALLLMLYRTLTSAFRPAELAPHLIDHLPPDIAPGEWLTLLEADPAVLNATPIEQFRHFVLVSLAIAGEHAGRFATFIGKLKQPLDPIQLQAISTLRTKIAEFSAQDPRAARGILEITKALDKHVEHISRQTAKEKTVYRENVHAMLIECAHSYCIDASNRALEGDYLTVLSAELEKYIPSAYYNDLVLDRGKALTLRWQAYKASKDLLDAAGIPLMLASKDMGELMYDYTLEHHDEMKTDELVDYWIPAFNQLPG